MKLICLQENLNRGLNIVSRAASNSTSLPILNNILLEAKKGSLKLTTTNLEIAIETSIRSKVEKTGSITIPSQLLTSFIGLLTRDPVNLELDKDELSLKCKNQNAKIKGIPSTEFPLIPKIEKKNHYKGKTKSFKEALQQVIFAVASTDTRPEISGVLFHFNSPEKGKLTLAATDSYRLAEKITDISKESNGGEESYIIPARSLQELVRIIDQDEGEIEIFPSKNQILFTIDDTQLISRTISGQYPDYQQIIPQQLKTKAVIDRETLIRLTKTASLFSKSGINDIRLEFTPSKDKLTIVSVNSQLGENKSEIKTEVTGQAGEIVFNYRYLLDGLANIKGDEVVIEIIDSTNPGVLRPVKAKDYLYIIMPIKQ